MFFRWKILICLLSLISSLHFLKCSRITFSGGVYNDILVALHPETNSSDCVGLIHNITDALRFTSSQLYVATDGKASIGSIKILIPSTWGFGFAECPELARANVTPAELYDLYEKADVKLSAKHPFAAGKLPWTKSYKGCENESESIYIPVEFFRGEDFDAETRGRILLAEWTKFRYGVFEEHAYFADPVFYPCYVLGGKVFYTGCSSTSLKPLMNSTTSDPILLATCEGLVRKNAVTLEGQLKTGNASYLLAPHLGNMVHFCSEEYQIGVSPTKHNVLCERRSVSEVVFSHKDFASNAELFPNRRRDQHRNEPRISLIRREGNFDQGYAFIIEDDTRMREHGRIKYVKQAMAQILQLVKPRTNVAMFKYEGADYYSKFFLKVFAEGDKIRLLSTVPDIETPSLSQYTYARARNQWSNRFTPPNPNNKQKSLLKILEALEHYKSEQWHIYMISSSPLLKLNEFLLEVQKSAHSLSILTFDDSKEWLQFNKIPNTNKVVFLPSCLTEPFNCYVKTCSLMLDLFTDILATNSSSFHHFTHKVVDFSFTGDQTHTFTISGSNFIDSLENFQLFLPTHSDSATAFLYSPTGKLCQSSKLLGYNYVITFDTLSSTGCSYENGDWRIQVIEGGERPEALVYTLIGLGETSKGSPSSNLFCSASLGKSLESSIFPTVGGLPVYVSVSTDSEQPVVNAEVTISIFKETQNQFPKTILLEDNGVDPDLVKNDGVYSGYVTDFSPEPSFHSGEVKIRSVRGKTKIITALNFTLANGAAILDARMEPKCCGSVIPTPILSDIGASSYSILLPSFFTGEGIDEEADIFPPSRIQAAIRVTEDTPDQLTIAFVAPGPDYSSSGVVNHYDICCTNSTHGNLDESFCSSLVRENLCQPVLSGTNQYCKISKAQISQDFYNGTEPENVSATVLYCSLRGVDNVGNLGPLSFSLFQINIDPEAINASNTECNSISDGCLPVDVFWALIGCMVGLILILFVIVMCWFCLTRAEQEERKRTDKNGQRISNWIDGFSRESLRSVYINQAYIQDSNGQLKLVASDGVLHPLDDSHENLSEGSSIRPVNDSLPMPTATQLDSGHKHVSWNANEDTTMIISRASAAHIPSEQTQSFKTFPKQPDPPKKNSAIGSEARVQLPRVVSSNSTLPSASHSITSVEPIEEATPIYASVFRKGRKQAGANNPLNHTPGDYSYHEEMEAENSYPIPYWSTSASKKTTQTSPGNQRASGPNAASGIPSRITTSNFRPLPPVRLDHFPSSESEAYSDMSQILRHAPKESNKPPTSDPFMKHGVNRKLHNSAERKPYLRASSNPPEKIHHEDRLHFKNPLPHYKSMEIQRPGNERMGSPPPPPPPPRIQNRDTVPPFQSPYINSGRIQAKQKTNHKDPYEEDDSDDWDNYEDSVDFDIKYKPGTSFA